METLNITIKIGDKTTQIVGLSPASALCEAAAIIEEEARIRLTTKLTNLMQNYDKSR